MSGIRAYVYVILSKTENVYLSAYIEYIYIFFNRVNRRTYRNRQTDTVLRHTAYTGQPATANDRRGATMTNTIPAAPATAPAELDTLELFVAGQPIPQGSKTATRRGVMFDTNAAVLKPWRAVISMTAAAELAAWARARGRPWRPDRPTAVYLTFVFHRLANAPKTKPVGPKTTAPDVDKLIRAVFDALSKVVYTDDSQVTQVFAVKRYAEPGEPAGVHIVVTAAAR